MRKLATITRFVGAAAVSWFVLGGLGTLFGIGLALLVGDGPAIWIVFALALVVAVFTAVLAPRIMSAAPGPVWLVRVAVSCVPLFFSSYMLLSGTPDWDPRPLLVGWAICVTAAVATWRRTRTFAGAESSVA